MGAKATRQERQMARQAKKQADRSGGDASPVIGMLYIVEVRMVSARTGEKIKKKILVVGGEASDIERKLRWIFDASAWAEFSISNVEKVREKVHTISTVVTQESPSPNPTIKRDEGTVEIPQGKTTVEQYDPKLYAIGITTTMLAKDDEHALRKVGHALVSFASKDKSHSGASLSDESRIQVEEVPKSSGYASPRDVSNETNRAHFVRG